MGFEWMTIILPSDGQEVSQQGTLEVSSSKKTKNKKRPSRGGAIGINMWEINVLSARFCYEP